jgi:uncharacterized protein YuzE
MKVTYSKAEDIAYIKIKENVLPGEAKNTCMCDPQQTGGSIIVLDFDDSYNLLGMEITGASKHLPQDLLKSSVEDG